MRVMAGKDYVLRLQRITKKEIKCIGYQHTPVLHNNISGFLEN